MTAHNHLKARIRARMHRTGESYMTARHIVLSARPGNTSDGTTDAALDLGGVTPEAATLRVLLTAVGATAPHTAQPWSEAMLFGLTGGVGVAVHTFRYERDDVSTLFVGARRPDIADGMVAGLDRLGIAHTVHETAGARTAATQLRGALTAYGPVAAWVDAATLGTRGMPASWEGGAYHVLAVLGVDDDAGTATLADLTAAPVVVASEQLDAARARIRKQRHRVLAVTAVPDEGADRLRYREVKPSDAAGKLMSTMRRPLDLRPPSPGGDLGDLGLTDADPGFAVAVLHEPPAEPEQPAEPQRASMLGERRGAHQVALGEGERAFGLSGSLVVEPLDGHQTEHRVAEELEPLVVPLAPLLVSAAAMRQGLIEQRAVVEVVPQALLELPQVVGGPLHAGDRSTRITIRLAIGRPCESGMGNAV